MIRKPISFPADRPLNRALAVEVVQVANRYESRVMISQKQKIVNAKSTLGLLALSADDLNDLVLIAEGPDEAEVAEAIAAVLA